MVKRGVALLILLIFIILSSGCQTMKGMFQGAAEGAKKDWEALKRADKRMREVLW